MTPLRTALATVATAAALVLLYLSQTHAAAFTPRQETIAGIGVACAVVLAATERRVR